MGGLRVTAPAKVILHGEHSVVYGKTALAASVDLRTTLTVQASPSGEWILSLPDLSTEHAWPEAAIRGLAGALGPGGAGGPAGGARAASQAHLDTIRQFLRDSKTAPPGDPEPGVVAALHLLTALLPPGPPLALHLSSAIPLGAGLGSSAAMSVCLAAGLYIAATRPDWQASPHTELSPADLEAVCGWAYTAECVMHGTPSGIDNSVSTHGGVVCYRQGVMEPLQDLAGLQVLLTDTGVGRNTRELVQGVKEKRRQLPAVVDPILEAMDQVSLAALASLRECREKGFKDCGPQFQSLEQLVDTNHCLLSSLGVSHPALETVRAIAAARGLHCKLTGAGGGGCAFTLLTPDTEEEQVRAAQAAMEAAGFRCYRAAIGGPGLLVVPLGD